MVLPARALATKRPRRGTPDVTRARLIAAAAVVFNRDGYHGTDSNRIARAAGYAPGTFYKHFRDKREVFLAAYEGWVTAEWAAIARAVRRGGTPGALAARVVDLVLDLHRRWRGLRASMLGLVAVDVTARRFYRHQRRLQLRMVHVLRTRLRGPGRRPEEDAVLLFTLERVCDALAHGEARDLGLAIAPTVRLLRRLVVRHFSLTERLG
jgi:AcrR family transcriptional regulator